MKKIIMSLLLALAVATSAYSMSLKEAYDEIDKLPDLQGVVNGGFTDILGGWIGYMPIEDAVSAYKVREVGLQTKYYGDAMEKVISSLPKSELILSGANDQNLIYMYARPVDAHNYEFLLLIDQAYQGKTIAIYGKIAARMIEALKKGSVRFTPDHKTIIEVPLMICS